MTDDPTKLRYQDHGSFQNNKLNKRKKDNKPRMEIIDIPDSLIFGIFGLLVFFVAAWFYNNYIEINRIQPIFIYHNFFSSSQTDMIISTAETFAQQNTWTTNRHKSYPTTDIPIYTMNHLYNVTIDHESVDFSLWLNQTVINQVFPLMKRNYQLDKHDQLTFKDFFIVKYNADAPNAQKSLAMHTDSSELTFHIALSTPKTNPLSLQTDPLLPQTITSPEEPTQINDQEQIDAYVGGGTTFYQDPQRQPLIVPKGSLVMHPSKLHHEGSMITQGKRYIIVGFINVQTSSSSSFFQKYLRNYGRFSRCLQYHTYNQQQELINQESLSCLSFTQIYSYELWLVFYNNFINSHGSKGFTRTLRQGMVVFLALSFLLLIIALFVLVWDIFALTLWKLAYRQKQYILKQYQNKSNSSTGSSTAGPQESTNNNMSDNNNTNNINDKDVNEIEDKEIMKKIK